MGTLIEQINELIGVLEIVDPEAAAALRGGQTPGRVNFGGQTSRQVNSGAQTPGQPNIGSSTPGRSNFEGPRPVISVTNTGMAGTGIHSGVSPRDSISNPLHLNIKSDNLMQGIIYSEILGKPVSRRHRYRG